jgi:hypothetical protein
MSYLRTVLFAQHYYDYVEAKRPLVDIIACKEISSGPYHSCFFWACDSRLRWTEILVRSGLDFDEDNASVVIDHNQIDFAALAGKIASECFETFVLEELLAALFAPSAERCFRFSIAGRFHRHFNFGPRLFPASKK